MKHAPSAEETGTIPTYTTTRSKRMVKETKESEQRFRSLVENSAVPIATTDLKGKLTYVNNALADLFGYSVQEMIGQPFKDFLYPKDRIRVLRLFLNIIPKRRQPRNLEFRARRKDGQVLHLMSKPIRFEINGKTVGFQAIIVDITELKKAEQKLQRSKERFQKLFDAMVDPVVIVDGEGKILEISKKVEETTGFRRKQLVGKNILKTDMITPKTKAKMMKDLPNRTAGMEIAPYEVEVLTKDKRKIIAEVNATKIEYMGKPAALAVFRDITERKKMEGKLQRSEEEFRKIFESASDAMIYLSKSGRILDVNRKAVEVFGGTKEELLGKHFTKVGVVSPKDIPRLLAAVTKGLAGKKATLDISIKNKRGKTVMLECSNSLTKMDDKLIGLLVIARDVTDRKIAEERIRRSEEKYRSLFENARDVIATFDTKGRITSVNKAVADYGFRRDEMIGRNMLKYVSKRHWQKVLKDLDKIAQGKLVEGELEIITPKGKKIAEYRSNPIRQGKKVVGLQTILRDATERKQMEEKLRQYSEHLEEVVQKRTDELLESEKRYSILVEEASDGVAIIQDGQIVFANKKSAEMIGYSKNEVIGLPFMKFVDEQDRQLVKERYKQRLGAKKAPGTYELNVTSKNGECIPVEISATVIDHQGCPADLIVIRDIEERKRMEEERLRLEKLATMGELAAMVAHDLRNPLTSIRNAGYYLKNSCPHHAKPECKTSLEMLDIIEKETIFADNIINELLDFAAEKPLEKKRQDVNNLIEDSITKLNLPQNIEVKRKLAKKAVANVDGKQLKRVFWNLIKNAVQAMPEGGKLTTETTETEDHIKIAITDTGVGILEKNMDRIFTPLFTTKAKGIGMGLPICTRIVKQHGGTIDVKSQVGKGTTFTIKLPKKQGENK